MKRLGAARWAKLVRVLNPDEARSVITAMEKVDSARVTLGRSPAKRKQVFRYQLRKG